MLIVPLQAVPSQAVSVNLAGQSCRIEVFQRRTGLFVNLYVLDKPIVLGAIALNANKLVRDAYLGFIGDLAFFDTLEAGADPTSDSLGSRFFLAYLEAADL